MAKPDKNCKRMWCTLYAVSTGKIEYVAVRDCEQRYTTPRLEYHNGAWWQEEQIEHFHDTEELALEWFRKEKRRRIEALGREIASLALREPKWVRK